MTEPGVVRNPGVTIGTPTGALAAATIDLAAVRHNTALLAAHTTAGLMAVVKADAFGHGIVDVARAALAAGAGWLGVTSSAEALRLRSAGVRAPILSWLHHADEELSALIAAGVDLSVSTPVHLRSVADAALRLGVPAQVHLKVDTGLSRNGATAADWPDLVAQARRAQDRGAVRVRAVWSHLATADVPGHAEVSRQVRRFDEAYAVARAAGLDPPLRHLANSAALLTAPRTHYDLVRAGIGLYGIEPVPGRVFGLRPAMTLRSRVVNVKRVPAGTGVSYGHTHVTRRATTLALVPLGYADGLPRAAAGRAQVWLAGTRRPIVGQIAMDQCVVDAGDLDVRCGDEVVVFGPGDRGEPTAADWARWAATNPHEILTGIGARVARRPVGRVCPAGGTP